MYDNKSLKYAVMLILISMLIIMLAPMVSAYVNGYDENYTIIEIGSHVTYVDDGHIELISFDDIESIVVSDINILNMHSEHGTRFEHEYTAYIPYDEIPDEYRYKIVSGE